eukprot:TRINITY_DN7768_c0_g1_i2.p1 TRINITY_DN7768_c0_g1~~TRINITY_DN7768_c0_g1_i2.p1  ORF type:complete len:366 (-),score=21.22 TRINITY_DN7768_c0_g1_i2:27-1124(-)
MWHVCPSREVLTCCAAVWSAAALASLLSSCCVVLMAWSVLRGAEALLQSSWYTVGLHRCQEVSWPEEGWKGDWAVQEYAPWEIFMLVCSMATVWPWFVVITLCIGFRRVAGVLLFALFASNVGRCTLWALGILVNLYSVEGLFLHMHGFVLHPFCSCTLIWLTGPREVTLRDYFRCGVPTVVLQMSVYIGAYSLTALDMNNELWRIFFVVVLPQIAGGLSFHCSVQAICTLTPVRNPDLVAVLVMTLPVTISAYSNFMQFAAASYASATLAEVVQLLMELSQHHNMLRGYTSVDKFHLFLTNAYSCGLRLLGLSAARQQGAPPPMSSVMPAYSMDVVGRPVEHEDDAVSPRACHVRRYIVLLDFA